MQKQKFSKKELKKLILESATFAYFFRDTLEFAAEKILAMSSEEQKKMFKILSEEREKFMEIDDKYREKEMILVNEYLIKIEEGKKKFKKNARTNKEAAEKSIEEKTAEKLLNNLK